MLEILWKTGDKYKTLFSLLFVPVLLEEILFTSEWFWFISRRSNDEKNQNTKIKKADLLSILDFLEDEAQPPKQKNLASEKLSFET